MTNPLTAAGQALVRKSRNWYAFGGIPVNTPGMKRAVIAIEQEARADTAALRKAALAVYHGRIGYMNPKDSDILALGAVLFPERATLEATDD